MIERYLLLLAALLLVANTARAQATSSSTAPIPTTQSLLDSANPLLGIQASFAATGFGTFGVANFATGETISPGNPLRLQVMLQPLHAFGVLQAGLTGEYFFRKSSALDAATSWGVQVGYEALYSPQQWVVPTASLSWENMSYRLANAPRDSLSARGRTLGLWLFLNALDPSGARSLFRNWGFSRTYVTLELRTLSGSSENASFNGDTYHLGFRIEI